MYENNALPNGEQRKFISPRELAERWGRTKQHWTRKCGSGDIKSIKRYGVWQIPMSWVVLEELKTEGETDEEKQCY